MGMEPHAAGEGRDVLMFVAAILFVFVVALSAGERAFASGSPALPNASPLEVYLLAVTAALGAG